MTDARWSVVELHGTAADLHAREIASPARRELWLMGVERPALVLGSTQPDETVDRSAAAAAGVDVARRRSGGGAVLIAPDQVLWVDAVVPRHDPLWEDDVGRASAWLGQAWAGALAALGVVADVHTGGLDRRRWSDLVCFAGLGPGEVTVGGAKLVGISQRRTREAARFQSVVLERWDPAALTGLLRLEPAVRASATAELAAAAAGAGDCDVSLAALRAALLDHLP